jgi:lipid-binding SYLF domain-containing protein
MNHIERTIIGSLLVFGLCNASAAAADEIATIEKAEGVLKEIMEIPAKRIPSELLAKSYGVAIIPNVIKIGFIGGVRRGYGVLLFKDKEGDWSLPEFVTLTGGSIGWQVGAQATDVILVFKTAKSVENIRQGKFTIGADASAAAGPVGRTAAAATDAQMQAEILSYSRSRGLFAGVSLDGSAMEMDSRSSRDFYGDPAQQPGRHVPASAVKLMDTVANLANVDAKGPIAGRAQDANQLRKDLAQSARVMNAILSPEWQRFLALPPAVYGTQEHPSLEALNGSRRNFDRVNTDGAYANLRSRTEFQATFELLKDYIAALEKSAILPITVPLPPPPIGK